MARVARSCSSTKANLPVLSIAANMRSLPSSVRTSAMSMWKYPIGSSLNFFFGSIPFFMSGKREMP